ncbi:hypothetical protein [Streptomyces inhibens]|uniref:hypothetical protein n=1 Tax=Streptomyces inhibens TaxID=2293571 RepID=UPI001EE6F0DC|nr:hypothetical protein [Streptomyces inhibens]UKY49230.1 hypothetical protein KI385_10770 [Streptomyces inhibens]
MNVGRSSKNGKVTVLSWNFERNGADDAAKRLHAHEMLVSLGPHLVFRREMWGAEHNDNEFMYELEDVLGLRGWLGPRACTALFAPPEVSAAAGVAADRPHAGAAADGHDPALHARGHPVHADRGGLLSPQLLSGSWSRR